MWFDWGPWTRCSKTCGGGLEMRERGCNVDIDLCFGQSMQRRPCNVHVSRINLFRIGFITKGTLEIIRLSIRKVILKAL